MVRRIPILAVVQPDLQPYYGRTQSTKQVTTVQDAKSRFRRCCQQMPGPHQISPGNQRCPMLLIIGGAGFHLGLWRRPVCKVSGRLLATLLHRYHFSSIPIQNWIRMGFGPGWASLGLDRRQTLWLPLQPGTGRRNELLLFRSSGLITTRTSLSLPPVDRFQDGCWVPGTHLSVPGLRASILNRDRRSVF